VLEVETAVTGVYVCKALSHDLARGFWFRFFVLFNPLVWHDKLYSTFQTLMMALALADDSCTSDPYLGFNSLSTNTIQ